MGRIESEGLDDGFGLDDLRVELLRVDLREKRHYQILEERLDKTEGFMSRFLVALAGNAAVDEVLNVGTDVRPYVVSTK